MTYSVSPRTQPRATTPQCRRVARLLLADSDPYSRVALETLLTTAGYAVDCAATSGEAAAKLDRDEYQLVLADLAGESEGSGHRLLAYARQKEFRPATALLTSRFLDGELTPEESEDNVLFLLGRVADLIGQRADRRMRRIMPVAHGE